MRIKVHSFSWLDLVFVVAVLCRTSTAAANTRRTTTRTALYSWYNDTMQVKKKARTMKRKPGPKGEGISMMVKTKGDRMDESHHNINSEKGMMMKRKKSTKKKTTAPTMIKTKDDRTDESHQKMKSKKGMMMNRKKSTQRKTPAPITPVPYLTPAPSANPPVDAPVTRASSILAHINSITLSNKTLRYCPNSTTDLSAEEQAVRWLIEEDWNTTVEDERSLRQRYGLATLWFLGDEPFFYDSPQTWVTSVPECQWWNVYCVNGDVTKLYLEGHGLQGQIPSDLGLLTTLTDMNIPDNDFTGTIPSDLGRLTSLQLLNLSFNPLLPGTIPLELGGLTELSFLLLQSIQLIGTVPSSLGSLKSLQHLYLNGNHLTGTIPSWLGSMMALRKLDLYANQFTGSIQSSLASMTDLEQLYLELNQLTGSIPSSLGAMKALMYLSLHNNTLTGTIPSGLGSALRALTGLWLYSNELTGTMPFCNSDASRTLYDLEADCDEIECPCCTKCWTTNGG